MSLIKSPKVPLDIEAIQNDLFSFPFTVCDDQKNPINLSSYTSAKMQVRDSETGSMIVCFSNTGSTYSIDITGRATGYYVVFTNCLSISPGNYVYDFEVKNSVQRLTICGGKYTVLSEITLS